MELDDFDRRLLNALQRDNQQTGEQLAQQVGLSSAACLRRAQRLREAGVIEQDVSILSPQAAGRRLTMIVLVTMERRNPDPSEAFRKLMRQDEAVTQCYLVTGSTDYVLVVAVEDMEAYEAFTQRYLYEPYIKKFESLASLTRVKYTTALPM
jgi:Lrp/AsnC family transcriptional regulator, leucine-responsive regulatory protein